VGADQVMSVTDTAPRRRPLPGCSDPSAHRSVAQGSPRGIVSGHQRRVVRRWFTAQAAAAENFPAKTFAAVADDQLVAGPSRPSEKTSGLVQADPGPVTVTVFALAPVVRPM